MGTITRSFANNITTSGILLPASLNNASLTNVTAYNASVATGNMVLLSSQTASNSASISFTTGINSTYKEYQFWFIDVHPRTDSSELQFNFSTDSGSNYNVTKTSTFFSAYHYENDNSTAFDYNGDFDLAQSTAYQKLNPFGIGSGADESLAGYMCLFNPASTTYVKHFISVTNDCDTDSVAGIQSNAYVAGYGNTTSAVNAVNFQMTAGNFDGTILMYGIV
jgi:hypothetical protein